jgi:hypothetical protein
MGTINYYAKVDAHGEIFYGATYRGKGGNMAIGHIETPQEAVLGLVQLHPDAQLVNRPNRNWQMFPHTDDYGEFSLRPLNEAEERAVLQALRGRN